MEAIKYITDNDGNHSGLLIDFDAAKKSLNEREDFISLMEDIEDIVAIELSKNEKSLPYEEARKQIFGKEE